MTLQATITHESRYQANEYRLTVTLANGVVNTYNLQREDVSSEATIDEIVSNADFTINYSLNRITQQHAEMQLHKYAKVKYEVQSSGHETAPGYPGATSTGWRIIWSGRIRRITYNDKSVSIYCTDRLGDLDKCRYDVGIFEADTIRITGTDVPPATAPKDAADGTFIQLKEIVEGSESRWIIPGNGNDNGAGAFAGTTYADAFTGGVADADEGNRRQWKFIGRVWVQDMNLNAPPTEYGQEIEYPDPLPRNFYDIGGDLGNYLEFKDGYTPPAGKKVWIEVAEVYVEGTNQIEDIWLSALNPRIPGRVTGVPSTTQITAARSRFVRDAIMVGGKIKKKGDPDGSAVDIESIDDQQNLTTATAHGLSVDDEFELFDCVEIAPRWQDGTEFNTTGTYGGLSPQTIWPSLITVNKFQWLVSDGSLLQMLEALLEFCPPNYRPMWDHKYDMFRLQYVEVTPFEQTSPYYVGGSYPYGAFDVPGALTPPEDGETSYWETRVKEQVTVEDDEETFASVVTCEGVNERPKNLLEDDEVKIITWPPGNTVSDFQHSAGIFSGDWNPIEKLGQHYSSGNYYAKWHGASGNRALNIRDVNVETLLGFENPAEIGEGDSFAPVYCIDLGQPTRIGTIVLWGANSWRDFTWGVRLECCDENGLTWDAVNSQYYPNTGAGWQLMHPDWYANRIKPWERKVVQGGWNTNYTRFVLISMSYAKVQLEDWCFVGLSEIQIFSEDVVYGQARIKGEGYICEGILTEVTWADPILGIATVDIVDSSTNFITAGVLVGDTVYDVSRGVSGTVTATNVGGDPNKMTVDFEYTSTPAPEGRVWAGDHYFVLSQSAPAVGTWVNHPGTDENDAVWTCNLPVLTKTLIDPIGGGGQGHVHETYEDTSLSTTDMCALRAAEILTETIRKRLSGDFVINWHNDVQLYHTVKLYDRRTGITFKGLVEGVTRNDGKLTLTVVVYTNSAWTLETPENVLDAI